MAATIAAGASRGGVLGVSGASVGCRSGFGAVRFSVRSGAKAVLAAGVAATIAAGASRGGVGAAGVAASGTGVLVLVVGVLVVGVLSGCRVFARAAGAAGSEAGSGAGSGAGRPRVRRLGALSLAGAGASTVGTATLVVPAVSTWGTSSDLLAGVLPGRARTRRSGVREVSLEGRSSSTADISSRLRGFASASSAVPDVASWLWRGELERACCGARGGPIR